MKIDFKKNKILRSIFAQSKKSGFDSYFNPARHWMFGLFVAASFFGTGIFFIGYDFYIQFGTSNLVSAVDDQVIMYNKKEVEEMATQLTQKQHLFEELRADHTSASSRKVEEITDTSETKQVDVPLASVELGQ